MNVGPYKLRKLEDNDRYTGNALIRPKKKHRISCFNVFWDLTVNEIKMYIYHREAKKGNGIMLDLPESR